MKIYPDGELPDLVVGWSDCLTGNSMVNSTVTIALSSFDSEARIDDVVVPCSGFSMQFEDVARERFYVGGTLQDASGHTLDRVEGEADLRAGLDEVVGLSFDERFWVAWTFETDATCESLGVTSMRIQFSSMEDVDFEFKAGCSYPFFGASPRAGTYIVRLRAESSTGPVAVSPPIPDVTITPGEDTDLGWVTLVPCSGAACL